MSRNHCDRPACQGLIGLYRYRRWRYHLCSQECLALDKQERPLLTLVSHRLLSLLHSVRVPRRERKADTAIPQAGD